MNLQFLPKKFNLKKKKRKEKKRKGRLGRGQGGTYTVMGKVAMSNIKPY